jgi:hypothetical protein
MSLKFDNREVLEEARHDAGGFILAFWHSRFLMMPYAYSGGRITVLLSRHRDAEMLARMIARFGLDTSRGSSTDSGAAALRDILRKVRTGFDVGIAPDGPRGPRRRAKPGVIDIARLTGLPIVPVAFSAAPARRLRSWDRSLVPRPFSAGCFVYGSRIAVPRLAGEADRERLRLLIERTLDELTDEADRRTGMGLEEPKPTPEPA